MPIKTIVRYHSTSVRMAETKLTIPISGDDIEQLKLFLLVGKLHKTATLESSLIVSYKFQYILAT